MTDIVLDAIRSYIAAHGYGPTLRELCASCGLSSLSVAHRVLKELEAEGRITRDGRRSRTIQIRRELA